MSVFSAKPILAAAMAATLLAGCSGLSQPPNGAAALSALRESGEVLRPDTPLLYLTGRQGSDIFIYSQSGKGQKPASTIAVPDSHQNFGLAVDGNGDLYVSSFTGGSDGVISVFHQGQNTPYRTLTDGGQGWGGVAVDSAGNVYESAIQGGGVYVFAAGSNTPTSELITNNDAAPYIAVDPAGDVFVTAGTTVEEFPSGSQTPVNLQNNSNYTFEGVALDSNENLIVAADAARNGVTPEIQVFAPPYNQNRPTAFYKTKDSVSGLSLNADGSALWYVDQSKQFATQLTYPGLRKIESTSKKGLGGLLYGIAAYPAAPL